MGMHNTPSIYRTARGKSLHRQRAAEDFLPPVDHGRTMLAKFTGKCVETGERINPGDTIKYVRGYGSTLISRGTTPPADGRYISDVFRTSGGEFYRNKNGRCEDAPCCGCCTI